MRSTDIKPKMRVRVITLDDDRGLQAAEEYINVRQVGVTGVVVGSNVPSNFDGLWLVKHDDESVTGVYVYFELEVLH